MKIVAPYCLTEEANGDEKAGECWEDVHNTCFGREVDRKFSSAPQDHRAAFSLSSMMGRSFLSLSIASKK
jgi:hypothetical protein